LHRIRAGAKSEHARFNLFGDFDSSPVSCEVIGDSGFYAAQSLSSISIRPSSQLTTIASSAFCQTGLERFLVPAQVTPLCVSCFGTSTNLASLEFPPGCRLTTLAMSATASTKVQPIRISGHVRVLDSTASALPHLNSVTFKDGSELARINRAFMGSSIASIAIPKSVEHRRELFQGLQITRNCSI
jgi:hypothetical protein